MIKVITYGTFDLLHYGHIQLLKKAKELGDYLIVGVTADDFDRLRGKINVQQSLMERLEAVKSAGFADEIIVEEYEGQKIDDIRKYDIDIFTVGSDWIGQFDYLNEYCRVIYLERTQGVSSSELRNKKRSIRLGLVGDSPFLHKVQAEAAFVNGIQVDVLCTQRIDWMKNWCQKINIMTDDFERMLPAVDAVYIRSLPQEHYGQIKTALEEGKHVLCESPLTIGQNKSSELFKIAVSKNIILMEAMKTAYSTAFSRLLLLVKGGEIGNVVSVEATCTSLRACEEKHPTDWSGVCEWGPTALLPIFQILGTQFEDFKIVAHFHDIEQREDSFVKIDFVYKHAVASIKIGDGVKSEGELIISGTKGYFYVPAPWWKTEYFEVRYEDQTNNKRFFYPLEGEGIRYELVAFARAIEHGKATTNIDRTVTNKISGVMEDFANHKNMTII